MARDSSWELSDKIQTMVLDDAVVPVEGLLVDMKDGGIGFRFHAIPVGLQHGAKWTEDLLFIKPETQCVDTNLTLDFNIKTGTDHGDTTFVEDLVLTDRGGFVNFMARYPQYDHSDMQRNPDLDGRAYKA